MPSYEPIRSVTRALEVLELLNRLPVASVGDLHAATGIPKPTLVRILETLEDGGYVARDATSRTIRILSRVRSLSDGFHEESRLVQHAAPLADALTRRIRWPLAIGVFDRDAMLIRHSTIPESPLALYRSTVELRLPMLASAMGLAYLAFCPSAERRLILDLLRHSDAAADRPARRRSDLTRRLDATRRRGHAIRASRGPAASGESGSISLPIRDGERVLACVSLTFMARVMSPATAARRHLTELQAFVDEVETTMREDV